MDVGKRIRQLREERGLSRNALGKIADMTGHSIYRIETARRPTPSLITLEKLADAMEVEVGEFFREPVDPKAPAPPKPGRPGGEAVESQLARVVAKRLESIPGPAYAMQAVEDVHDFATTSPREWADLVHLCKEHNKNLSPVFRAWAASLLTMQDYFWAAMATLGVGSTDGGEIAGWPEDARRSVYRTLAALILLHEFYMQLRRKALSSDADPDNFRAVREEFIDTPPVWKQDPLWSEAMAEERELVGVGAEAAE